MKKYKLCFYVAVTIFFLSACSDFLDLKPLDKVSAEALLSNENGINLLLANLYNQMPVEDFSYFPDIQFNYHGGGSNSGKIDRGHSTSFFTDESVNTLGLNNNGISAVGPVNDGYWAYGSIRQVNQFIEDLQVVDLKESTREQLIGEAHFIRAYYYFGLVKRYGGVPVIESVQKIEGGDNANLYVPRSTEKETWDFILKECDDAISRLPETRTSGEGLYRATKWVACALKSRAALHAASIAKFWDKAPLAGEAANQKLVGGMTLSDADNYYTQCIDASKLIIQNSGKKLYKPNPVDAVEAAKNYQDIFQGPANSEIFNEVIFLKAYIDGSTTRLQGHSTDAFFNPKQTTLGGKCGRFSPALDLVDLYEDYTDDGSGKSIPLKTRTDGVEDQFEGQPETGIDLTKPFKVYDNVTDIFAGKDARLFASIIVPGSKWKDKIIIMQAGLIGKDGSQMIYQEGSSVGNDGLTYYSYGSASESQFSGFKYLGSGLQELTDFSTTGFTLKKFLQENKIINGTEYASTTPFIDFRLPEIYMNYAEAVLESGKGDATLAKTCLNDIRKRAAHKDNIELTLENVLKERRIELAFEGQRYWDLVRRRDYHSKFNAIRRKSLLPVLDLRQSTPKYIFVRADNFNDMKNTTTFYEKYYYRPIPEVTTNKLIQNPEY
jgi:starch-binding outer membrane protein, SusD/RagB family